MTLSPYQRLELFFKPFHFLCLAQIRRRQILHHRQSGQHHHYPQHPYTDYSYGFQFTTNQIEVEGEENAIVAQILYVADGSPASEIGLKQGDWIMKMDGNFITEQNYKKLYGSSAMELTVGYYDVEKNAIVAHDKPDR